MMNRPKHLTTITLSAIFIIAFSQSYLCSADASSYSFVYNYGNAKVWVFIETGKNLTVGSNRNSTITLTVYLEKLGNNSAIFLNRITFSLKETPVEKVTSPNVTLQTDKQSWSYNVTFSDEDVSPILKIGQALDGDMSFEFRYDVIDPTGDTWSYRVNEDLPVRLISIQDLWPQWISFEKLFIIITLVGIGSAAILIWVRIRKYKKDLKLANANLTSRN